MASVADNLERRGRIAPEHAPASLQLLAHGSLQRMAVSVEISPVTTTLPLSGDGFAPSSSVSGLGLPSRSAGILPAERDRHRRAAAAAQPGDRATVHEPPRIARRRRPSNERVVVVSSRSANSIIRMPFCSAEPAATRRHARMSRRPRLPRSAARPDRHGERLVPCIKPTRILNSVDERTVAATPDRLFSSRGPTQRGKRPGDQPLARPDAVALPSTPSLQVKLSQAAFGRSMISPGWAASSRNSIGRRA